MYWSEAYWGLKSQVISYEKAITSEADLYTTFFFSVDISAGPSPFGPSKTGLHQHFSPTWFRTLRLNTPQGPGCCSLWLFHRRLRYDLTRSWMPGTTWSGICDAPIYLHCELGTTPRDLCKNSFDISSKDITVTTCCHILCVMGDIATHLNEDTKTRIVGKWWIFHVVQILGESGVHRYLYLQAIWCHAWRLLLYHWRLSVLPWRLFVN